MAEQTTNAAAGTPRAELFVLSGPDVGRSFAVSHASTLGRAPDRTVVLRDKSISRHHAHFEFDQGRWSIVDDGSTNGFVVDGSRQERALLTDLSDFQIGEVLVRLRTQVAEPSAPAPRAPLQAAGAAPTTPAPPAIEDEIRLEEEIVLEPAAPARPAHSFGQSLSALSAAAPAAPAPERSAAARAAAAGIPARAADSAALGARGQRALQFHKQEPRQGFLVSDLSQQPAWVRALVLVIVLAFGAALAWGAYRWMLSLRQERAPPPPEAGQ